MKRSSVVWLVAILVLAACTSEHVEVLKSPCASLDGSPCGPKRDVKGNPQSIG